MAKTYRAKSWHKFVCGARIRILAWYLGLMTCSAVLSILVIRQILCTHLEVKTRHSLSLEAEEFRRMVVTELNPSTGQAFGANDGPRLLDIFLTRKVTPSGKTIATFLNGELYRASPSPLPELLQPNSALVRNWANLSQPTQGMQQTSTDTLLYVAEPFNLGGQTRGVVVFTKTNAWVGRQVNEIVLLVAQVTASVLAGASVLAWVTTGRVLAPLHLLTETARSITESDMTQRIPVRGSDEISELTITFNEMLDRLESAFTSQRDFIKDASHELRTPITIIRCHLELLPDDPQERQETIALVTDELDRMSRFVNDLLFLAKTERPDFLKPAPVELATLTEELHAKAAALAPRHWQLEHQGSGSIVVDRQRITQAVMNLAQNATQHTSERDTIALGSALSDHEVRFWVRDTGEGIALEDQERIFERFARTTHSQRRSEGAGLGLSIVQALVKAHGGRVELFSRLGEGSRFTVILPRISAPEAGVVEPLTRRRAQPLLPLLAKPISHANSLLSQRRP